MNLLAVKVASQDQDLFVNARVQGLLFQGPGSNETDSVFVFLDEDNNRKLLSAIDPGDDPRRPAAELSLS